MQVAEEMVWELFTQAGPVGERTQPWHADKLQQLQHGGCIGRKEGTPPALMHPLHASLQ